MKFKMLLILELYLYLVFVCILFLSLSSIDLFKGSIKSVFASLKNSETLVLVFLLCFGNQI